MGATAVGGSPVAVTLFVAWGACLAYRDACYLPRSPSRPAPDAKPAPAPGPGLDRAAAARAAGPQKVFVSLCSN